MKNTVFYLSTCGTCKKILTEVNTENLELIDIKKNPIMETVLNQLKKLAGSYEALFSRKAQLYKEYDLKNKTLSEADYKAFLLEHYTFLSRPVFVINNQIFIGNKAETVQKIKSTLHV